MLYFDFLEIMLHEKDGDGEWSFKSDNTQLSQIYRTTRCLSFYLSYGIDKEYEENTCIDPSLLEENSTRTYLLISDKYRKDKCKKEKENKLKENKQNTENIENKKEREKKEKQNKKDEKKRLNQCLSPKPSYTKVRDILMYTPNFKLLQYDYFLDGKKENSIEMNKKLIEQKKGEQKGCELESSQYIDIEKNTTNYQLHKLINAQNQMESRFSLW